ncbi:MAG: GMP synthase, partial [Chitinophagales bacterium]
MPESKKIKLAILDMYEGAANEGMRCIKAIAQSQAGFVDYKVFDVRAKGEIPDKSYDIFISSGGPG